jgi:hypothetical protein
MLENVKAELLAINYTGNYVTFLVKVPMADMQTLQKYGLLKTPLEKAKEQELLKELKEKLKGDKTIRKLIKEELDKANKYVYIYNPEKEQIKIELYQINIQKEAVDLYYKVTFILKNQQK